jgi:predicted aconitase with swiveling domain
VETEPIIATALVLARLLYRITIPLVDRLEEDILGVVDEGTLIRVDGDRGEVSFHF